MKTTDYNSIAILILLVRIAITAVIATVTTISATRREPPICPPFDVCLSSGFRHLHLLIRSCSEGKKGHGKHKELAEQETKHENELSRTT